MSCLDTVAILVTYFLLGCNQAAVQAFRVFDVNGVNTIFAVENETISIVCKAGIQMAYCGFIHPSGKRFSFSGLSLIDGICKKQIRTRKEDAGIWRCHIGKRTIGVEIKQDIQLRVVDDVAAVESNITAVHGKEATISCITTKEKLPLRYCRFEPPNGIPFSIDPGVTAAQPILGKYYYPQNKSLDRGDCAVSIRKVKYSDVGDWTCGVGLDDGKEHTDVIRVDVEGFYTMSTASTTGITFGTIGIIAFLIILGFVVWNKRSFLGTAERVPEAIEIQDLPRAETPGSQRTPVESRRDVPVLVVQSPTEEGSHGSPSPRL